MWKVLQPGCLQLCVFRSLITQKQYVFLYWHAGTQQSDFKGETSYSDHWRSNPQIKWCCIFFEIRSNFGIPPTWARRGITTHNDLRNPERSQKIQTLNFGTNSAAEISQNVIQTTFQDIECCLNISEDILIFAKTQEEHDRSLEAVLQRADEKNLRFNDAKCDTYSRKQEYHLVLKRSQPSSLWNTRLMFMNNNIWHLHSLSIDESHGNV